MAFHVCWELCRFLPCLLQLPGSQLHLSKDVGCLFDKIAFAGLGEDRDSLAAFLFTWPDGNTSKPALKLPKVCSSAQHAAQPPHIDYLCILHCQD